MNTIEMISKVDELLLELEELYESEKMSDEEGASYENFLYNLRDRI